MPTVTVKWVSMHDNNVCPICEELDKIATWTYTHQNPPDSNSLEYNGAIVWDDIRGSAAHGHHKNGAKCRCHLERSWDFSDMKAAAEKKLDEIKAPRGIT